MGATYVPAFLDYPLDREMYETRPFSKVIEPIRILLTDAAHKFIYCLIYKICIGDVFGPEQSVYIHLVNAKGVVDHKSIFLELEECGFELLKGWEVTSNVQEAYDDMDIVVFTTSFEEQSGLTHEETLIGNIIRGRYMMRYIAEYCKPKVKVVFVGPSTKFTLLTMYLMHRLEPKIPPENLTTVTLLDEAIARAHLAARLKTTTNKIRNIVIWGMTCPDVRNATVRTLPPGDLGALEEVELPVRDVLQDDKYLNDEFVECIFRRRIGHEFSQSGKSLALATARHLKALWQGITDDEIISMGVLTPSSEPCMVDGGLPLSFPVAMEDGKWRIREEIEYDVRTHLNLIRTCHRMKNDKTMKAINATIDYILNYEESANELIRINQKSEMTNLLEIDPWEVKYFLSPLPQEAIPKTKSVRMRKSIAWDDMRSLRKHENFKRMSSIRFSFEETKKQERKSSILKSRCGSAGSVFLPPIMPMTKKKGSA